MSSIVNFTNYSMFYIFFIWFYCMYNYVKLSFNPIRPLFIYVILLGFDKIKRYAKCDLL